jgi:hypothetical protein
MKKLKLIFTFLLLVLSLGASAQTEGATWSSIKVQKKLSKQFKVFMEPQLRWTDTELEQRLLETGVDYEPIKYFSTTVIHRYSIKTTNNGRERTHRFALDLNGKMDVNNWEPEVRIRYTNLKDFNADGGGNFLRYKIGVGYDIKKIKTKPEISAEAFQELIGNTIRKWRYTVGASYDINKDVSTGLSYKRESFRTKQKYVNIIDLSVKVKI